MNQRVLTYGLAAWAVIATIILLVGPSEEPTPPTQVETVQRPATAAPAEKEVPQADEANEGQSLARYDLCVSEGVPQLILPQLEGQPLLGIHCGSSARLLRVVAGEPLVLLDVTLTISPPHAHAVPAPLLLSDINADKRPDLLVGQRYEDSEGVPISGAVAVLYGASRGGFEPPQKLLAAHPLSLFAEKPNDASPDTQPSLAILHGRNPNHGQGPQLWFYSGSRVPPRSIQNTLPSSSRILGHVDLNRDGQQELLLAGNHDGKAGLWVWQLNEADESAQRFLPLGALNAATVGDIDGDGKDDVLLAGEALFTLIGGRNAADASEVEHSRCNGEQAGKACHRDPQLLTLVGKQSTLKSYRHPHIQLFADDGEPRQITLTGTELSVLNTHIHDVDGDGHADLITIVHPSNNARAAQLGWLSNALANDEVDLGEHRGALPEALLHTSDGLE